MTDMPVRAGFQSRSTHSASRTLASARFRVKHNQQETCTKRIRYVSTILKKRGSFLELRKVSVFPALSATQRPTMLCATGRYGNMASSFRVKCPDPTLRRCQDRSQTRTSSANSLPSQVPTRTSSLNGGPRSETRQALPAACRGRCQIRTSNPNRHQVQ